MKKTLRNLMLGMMTLIAGSALTSCSNDDEPQVAQQEGQKGYVEFTLSRGADTRTAYSFNEETKGLDVTWSKGDKVLVLYGLYEKEEEDIGEVFDMVEGGAGKTTATFAKSDSQLADKSGDIIIYYIPNYEKFTSENIIDISTQEGTLEGLSNYDAFIYEGTLSGGKISVEKCILPMTILHFPEGLDFSVNAATADFVFSGGSNALRFGSAPSEGDITVKGVSLSGGKLSQDLYVVVMALDAKTPTKLTVSDKEFSLPTGLESGNIYTFAQKDLTAE